MILNEELGWGSPEDLDDECVAVATVTDGIEHRIEGHSRAGLGNLPGFTLPQLVRVGDDNPTAVDWHRFKVALLSRMSAQQVPGEVALSELQSKSCLSPSLKKGVGRCTTLKDALQYVNKKHHAFVIGFAGSNKQTVLQTRGSGRC